MSTQYNESLAHFSLPVFKPEWVRVVRGIEKESLRVTPAGRLAQTDHPRALGSALTHPYITTDYSEALLELITPTATSIDECLQFLADLHNFALARLPDQEMLWAASMPCLLESEAQIPLARYGSSNLGRLKTLYREGLGHRYGRLMQTIAGIHYNFSMPEGFWPEYRALKGAKESLQEFQTGQYLHLIRNYHRYSWLLVYLFGASPAVCKCFTRGRSHDLEEFDSATLFKPYATCLRMGNLGYKSEAQKSLFVCYNELDNYIECLQEAMSIPYPAYEQLGLMRGQNHLQINTNLLQLENEFYATIRPKRVGDPGQRPLEVLRDQGIQYVEVRLLDLNPFLPLGIDAEQIRFLDAFLLFCLLSESPECHREEYFENERNLAEVVNQGRAEGLLLNFQGREISLQEWGRQLFAQIMHSASLLDGTGQQAHQQSVAAQQAKLLDSTLTPSAQMLQAMRADKLSFSAFGLQQTKIHGDYFSKLAMSPERLQEFTRVSADSLQQQAEAEAADDIDFDEFLQQWNSFTLA
ncbi:MAG: glutamate--cysteine ligase [Pseudomonadales bacterium]|nr:glutamate--cysteine ligase [Pseudomonadales bacterium]